jgi:hypothetical protein
VRYLRHSIAETGLSSNSAGSFRVVLIIDVSNLHLTAVERNSVATLVTVMEKFNKAAGL